MAWRISAARSRTDVSYRYWFRRLAVMPIWIILQYDENRSTNWRGVHEVRTRGPRDICRPSAQRREESEGHGGVRLRNLAPPPKLARAALDPPTANESCLLGLGIQIIGRGDV